MTQQLQRLVEQAKTRAQMTSTERDEQRIGFAYGNAPKDDRNTIETVREIASATRGVGETKAGA